MRSTASCGIPAPDTPAISEKIVAGTLSAIQRLLPESRIRQVCAQVQYPWRQGVLPPPVTVLHMILAALWPESSFEASWQVQWAAAISRYPELAGRCPSRGTVARARARLPLAVWERLCAHVSEMTQVRGETFASWRGYRVVLLDGTCISMPDEPALREAFGVHTRDLENGRYPLARVATLCLAGTMGVIAYALGGCRQSEWALALTILGTLRRGDVLIADRSFAAAHHYGRYQSLGLEFLTPAHQRRRIARIQRVQSYGPRDFLGWLTIRPSYRGKDRTLPSRLLVRFVQTTVRARDRPRGIWLVTSLLDDRQYPAAEIVQLYARRWRIETAFEQLKVRLSADVLRSHSPDGVRKEFAARCIALNMVHAIILEAARVHHVDPLRISFAHAVRAILIFSPALACAPVVRRPQIYGALITEIAHHLVPERPGRTAPRVFRREHRHYPTLREIRAEGKKGYAA
jgi:hypothetical protein